MYWVHNDDGTFELLDGQQRTISFCSFVVGEYIMNFDNNLRGMDNMAYERQQGICPACGRHFAIDEMEADHITPWHAGGKTVAENCQMLCRECNRRKSGK